ncbi:hypothetical protein GGX14DRAFT_604816 [Mycena pura]|uniref:AB hydrolase-1 domain-containing protein n=1 Tax=Mycena pura TaxID=153505 RepID=A0AAD6YJR6_9AGAR|nr:hypothetical protein GGX14DRAFT_604816 [Mycena pura]
MVPPQLLYPLTVESTVQFTYCLDRPLQCIATKYTCREGSESAHGSPPGCTLIFASGISLLQGTWIPLMKELFRILSAKINSIWVIERPNHGDAALLNAEVLKEHYSIQFPSLQYSFAIHTFLTSDILSASERSHLIGIGHSGGGGSLIRALDYGRREGHEIPLRTLVMLETPLVGPEAWPFLEILYRSVAKSNARRTTSWPSKADAMVWYKTHFPWKTFDPDVLTIIEDTYFIPDPRKPGYVTTKTTLEQETACFIDNENQLQSYLFLRTVLDVLPTHIVCGSLQDLWPAGMYVLIDDNTRSVRSQLASVTVLPQVGHYFPVVKPQLAAAKIVEIIQQELHDSDPRSKL